MKGLFATLGIIALCLAGFWSWFASPPMAISRLDAGTTTWRPSGAPLVGGNGLPVNPPITFHTMHVGVNNTDQLWIATAPRQELAWSVEEDMYVPEGPTMDNEGRVYFSPLYPQEDVSLVVLDGANGKRLWTLPHGGDSKGAGAPLILSVPGGGGKQIVYHATYHRAWAVDTSGNILWQQPTGLNYSGDGVPPHAWGMNYVAQLDALVSVTQDGKVTALSRQTGETLLERPFDLPGMPAGEDATNMPMQWVLDRGNALAAARFGETPDGRGLFVEMVRIIYGAGSEVSNFYAVDPQSGRLFIAATAPDEADGQTDGVSRHGSLYALDWGKNGNKLSLNIAARFDFDGGTGSTPTVSNDGQRVYVSDENGNIFALDRDLTEVWRINVGDQLAASVAVSADNAELYAVTRRDIFKLWDRGDHAELAWTATLDVFPFHNNINTLTPTITANGLAVSIGASREIGKTSLLMEAGYGLLDRATGKVRGFVLSPEESVAVTVVDRDGGFTIAHSPVRRLGSVALFGDKLPAIRGGISKFRSSDDQLLAREAACAAAAIAQRRNALQSSATAARAWDEAQIAALLTQAGRALARSSSKVDSALSATAMCAALQ